MADRFRILEKERERKKRMIRFLFFFLAMICLISEGMWSARMYDFQTHIFFGCGRDVHAAACIFEQKPAKNSSRVFYRTILSVSSDSRVCDGA